MMAVKLALTTVGRMVGRTVDLLGDWMAALKADWMVVQRVG